jgi:hypothetical protein
MRPMVLVIPLCLAACMIETTAAEGERPIGYACQSAWSCERGQCLLLGDNAQNKVGICTSSCRNDSQCGADERCYASSNGGGRYCLKACTQSSACADGFVCTGHDPSVCFVEPRVDGAGACATSVYGSCQNSARTECSERAGVADADRAKDEAACTASPGAIWSDGPCPLLELVGGCRQGCTPSNQTTWYYGGGPYASRAAVDAHCRASGLTAVAPP